jgi:uncharacterized membrane protein
MSWAYLHTLINHFPIVLTVIGALAVLLAATVERRAIWVYALSTLVLAGVTIYPAWLTGGRAAGMVRKAWYIAPGAIHAHSSAADITVWVVGVTGLIALIALITLVRVREALSPAKGFRILVELGALLSICAVGYTGYLGGQIVVESPVLKSPTPPVIPAPAPTTNPATQPSSTPSTQQLPPAANPANPANPIGPASPAGPPSAAPVGTLQTPTPQPSPSQPQQTKQPQMTVPVTAPKPQTA